MENKADMTYCAFCYERFKGHSAADTYLRALKRTREREEGGEPSSLLPAYDIPDEKSFTPPQLQQTTTAFSWSKEFRNLKTLAVRYWRPAFILIGGIALFLFIENAIDPATRFHYFGTRFTYSFPFSTPVTYICGYTTEATRWSERAQQMDTPLGDIKIEEVGTIHVQEVQENKKSLPLIEVASNNWLINVHTKNGVKSSIVPENSPSLIASHFALDKHGEVIRRQYGPSTRMARNAVFISPRWPTGRIKEKQTWDDAAEWSDPLEGWTIFWSAQRHWHVEGLAPCGENTCALLVYEADLTPRMSEQPNWMHNVAWVRAVIHATGDVIFDMTQHQVVSHHLTYETTLRGMIPDLSEIPAAMRVGRRAFHTRGEIIFTLKNQTSIQRQ